MNHPHRTPRFHAPWRLLFTSLTLLWLGVPPASWCAPAPLRVSSGGAASEPASGTASPARLPADADSVAARLQQLDATLADVRKRAGAAVPEATSEELAEWQRLQQQWVVALGAHSSSLRRLQEIRPLNQSRVADAEAWRGFSEVSPYPVSLVEGIRDEIAALQLDMRTGQMLLEISESGVNRGAALLAESEKQVRLARDQAEAAAVPGPREQWLLRLAETRRHVSEAMVEASEAARLVALEQLGGQRLYLQFLERKLAAAQAQARFTQADLDEVVARVNQRREALRRELEGAVASHAELSTALAAAHDESRRADQTAGTSAERLRDLRAVAAAGQARCDTAALKVEMLRLFLVLADQTQTLWEDRFWATREHSLLELRQKRQARLDSLAALRPWKELAELKLAAAASEVLTQSLRASGPELSPVERQAAEQARVAIAERANLYQHALSVLTLVESARDRLLADLAAREAQISMAGRARFVLARIAVFGRRIWDTELYVAEVAVVADGQKISVPRTITLGKVAIALGILCAGVLVAQVGQRIAKRTAARWFRAGERRSSVAAKGMAGLVILVSFCVAMASVRIPWTVFAFLGGALAIGVGFGAQTLINNFISGVILLFERSIRVGDIVEVAEQRGKVIHVGFRNSLIRRSDGIDVLVPNSKFLESEVVNWTLTDDLVRYKVPVGVAYGSPVDKVFALMAQAAAEHPQVAKDPAPLVLLDDFGDNALVFALAFWTKVGPSRDGATIRSELRRRIHALFEAAGIVLAFPQRDVHLDSVRPLDVRVIPQTQTPSDPAPPRA
jgi:potassium-dependent mechanosensitive channel